MNEVSIYKLNMRLTGRITQIPDSQKIFGALIYMYSENCSQDEASDFVSRIKNKEVYFSLSNMLPRDYLPVPQIYLIKKLSEKSKERYKKIKKRQYMRAEQVLKYIFNPNMDSDVYPYVCSQLSQQIHASIESLRYNIPGLDSKLYSVPEITVLEVNKENDKEIKKPLNLFDIYIAVDNSEENYKFINVLREAEKDKQALFLGPRASQGLNTFIIEEINKCDDLINEKSKLYLNLGMLLPNAIDFERSTIKLFTSERSPYNGEYGLDKTLKGKFISFIDVGSIIYTDEDFNCISKCIDSPFNARDIVFGNSFVLPLIDREGGYNE